MRISAQLALDPHIPDGRLGWRIENVPIGAVHHRVQEAVS